MLTIFDFIFFYMKVYWWLSNSPYSVISHKTIHTRKTVVSPCINYQHCIYLLVFMDDVQKLSELVSLNILLLSKMVNIPVLEFLQHYTGRFVTEVHKSDKGWNIVCVKNSVGKGYICVKSRPTRRVCCHLDLHGTSVLHEQAGRLSSEAKQSC